MQGAVSGVAMPLSFMNTPGQYPIKEDFHPSCLSLHRPPVDDICCEVLYNNAQSCCAIIKS